MHLGLNKKRSSEEGDLDDRVVESEDLLRGAETGLGVQGEEARQGWSRHEECQALCESYSPRRLACGISPKS